MTSKTSGGVTITGSVLAAAMTMTLTVKNDNTYTGSGTLLIVATTDAGTWSKSGTTYTFTSVGGTARTGTLSGNAFTSTDASGTITVYTKS